MKLALIGGISDYSQQTKLSACSKDAATMREFLRATNNYDDICFISNSATGEVAKKIIVEFIQKHKGSKIAELLFFFSGHGDRDDSDFFYAFSDYGRGNRESAGLRNSELDNLIRNLSPDLTIKIVDACYSGSTYIKAEEDLAPVIRKSAESHGLKNLYFFHSSSDQEQSIADRDGYSWFTEAIFKSLAIRDGEVRYQDLISAVADNLEHRKGPRPTFVVQATSLEVFVEMNETLRGVLLRALPHIGGSLPASGESDKGSSFNASGTAAVTMEVSDNSLARLAEIKANEVYCTQEEAERNLAHLNILVNEENWPTELKDVYDIASKKVEIDDIPNVKEIAGWIFLNKNSSLFVEPIFDTVTYSVQEYKEMPRKPLSRSGDKSSIFARTVLRDMYGPRSDDFKLETVEKQRQVVSGFYYNVNPIFEPVAIFFHPKLSSLEEYCVHFVCVFSRSSLTVFYSIEDLPLVGWGSAKRPEAAKWKQVSVSLKDEGRIKILAVDLIKEVSEFIEEDARKRLS